MKTIALTDVLASFEIPVVKVGADSAYYNCPFCDDKKAKFNVIPAPSNVWHCAKCGEGGGLVQFVEKINNCNREEARKFLREFNSSTSYQFSEEVQKKFEKARQNQEKLASDDVLHAVYTSMLKKLNLREEHYNDLKRRGLSDTAIFYREYKSVPKSINKGYNTTIPREIMNEGLSLKGVPGFFKRDGKWYMNNLVQGYLIPYRNVDGKITNLQIRTDNPEKSGKYISFSSTGLPHGTKVSQQAHFISKTSSPEVVYLTEGGLKGDIASYYVKKIYGKNASFLCIPGVNGTQCLIKALTVLKKRGLKKVVDAFDMDKCRPNYCPDIKECSENCKYKDKCTCNKNVEKAIMKIKNICKDELFLDYSQMTWQSSEKGIDDYLLAKYKNSQY